MAAPQRGLGKGLSALFSESSVTVAVPPQAQAQVPIPPAPGSQEAAKGEPSFTRGLHIQQVHPGKFQPRQHFAAEQLNELADSIRKNGIMQPIIVRPSAEHPGGYEIVAGERRWRAARMAGLDTIPAIVRDLSDQQALELALVENIQRSDLSPLEEARGYQRLIGEFGYTQEELAATVGKSRSHVANLMRLLSLPEPVRELLEAEQITMGHARALLNVPNAAEIADKIAKRGLSVRQAEALARAAQGVEKKSRPRAGTQTGLPYHDVPQEKNADILALEDMLSESLGLKVSIRDRGNSGEILLSYGSLTQLDEILRRLGGSA